jgi:hypothetical protein
MKREERRKKKEESHSMIKNKIKLKMLNYVLVHIEIIK